MRDNGIPRVVTWRWAPFAALVLGSLSFVGFALLVIPEHIGAAGADGSSSLRLGGHFAANQAKPPGAANWSGSSPENGTSTQVDSALPSHVTRVATHGADVFPKRGFSPPLERAESLVQAPTPPPAVIPQAPPAVVPAPPPEAAPAPAPEAAPAPAQPDLPPPGSGPAPGPVTPQND